MKDVFTAGVGLWQLPTSENGDIFSYSFVHHRHHRSAFICLSWKWYITKSIWSLHSQREGERAVERSTGSYLLLNQPMFCNLKLLQTISQVFCELPTTTCICNKKVNERKPDVPVEKGLLRDNKETLAAFLFGKAKINHKTWKNTHVYFTVRYTCFSASLSLWRKYSVNETKNTEKCSSHENSQQIWIIKCLIHY